MMFLVYSRQQMHGLASWHPPLDLTHAIISMTDPGNPEAELPIGPRTDGVLRMQFWDRTKPEDIPVGRPGTILTPALAAEIVTFARARSTVDAMIVHCEMGLARSHAVAAALAKGLHVQDNSLHFTQGRPNPFVYRLVLEACA